MQGQSLRKSGTMAHGTALKSEDEETEARLTGGVLEIQGFWSDSHMHGALGNDTRRTDSHNTAWEAVTSHFQE